MHSQYKYKGDNCYLSFQESLCRFNQNEINSIIESAFWRAHNKLFKNVLYIVLCKNMLPEIIWFFQKSVERS